MRNTHLTSPFTVALVALAMTTPSPARTPTDPIEWSLVLTQIPRDAASRPGRADGMLRAEYGDGGRIVRVAPDGTVKVLTEAFASACEPDVSFDGERILFAAKQRPADPWDIWEMNADGTSARRITQDMGNCRNPVYQSTLYTIVSTEPWYQIMFVSDRAGRLNEYGSGKATSLYSCRLDGGGVRRLTLNLSDDMDPFLMDDGRVLLASWQRMDLRRGSLGRVALFGVNTDGTDYALFCGDQGRRIKHMPCVTPQGLVVFVEADAVDWDGAGQLSSVTLRRRFHSHRSVTRDSNVVYHAPVPLPDGMVLVSARPADGAGSHAVFRLDPRTGDRQRIFDDPRFHDMHAKAIVSRPQPDGRSSVVNEEFSTGKLYCLNAYLTDPALRSHVRPGMIHALRVLEGVPRVANGQDASGPVRAGSHPNGRVPVVQKRMLGRVPVEKDGSFQIELPADVPVQLQTLDADGMALRTCGWIWAKHREPRGCIGCHEDPELTPENRFVQALWHPAPKLTLPADQRRTVDFRRDLMPIIGRKCAPCHTGGGAQPDSRGAQPDLRPARRGQFNQAYESLLSPAPRSGTGGKAPQDVSARGKYVHAGQARTSPLIWRLFGRNTSRPWDATYKPEQSVPICPPASAHALTEAERLVFIEWIDLGAHWDGIPGPDGPASAVRTRAQTSCTFDMGGTGILPIRLRAGRPYHPKTIVRFVHARALSDDAERKGPK